MKRRMMEDDDAMMEDDDAYDDEDDVGNDYDYRALETMGGMIMMIQKMHVSITRWDKVLNSLITDSHKVYVCASLPACLIT